MKKIVAIISLIIVLAVVTALPSFALESDVPSLALDYALDANNGVKIVKVPASRLPKDCAFILTHPIAATGPKQLEEYKIHDNPPGISGWLCEGRFIYDCFVLNEKADAIFYHGAAISD